MKKFYCFFVCILLLFIDTVCAVDSNNAEITEINQLNAKKIGILSGSMFFDIAEKQINAATIEYFNNVADLSLATIQGKIDGFLIDEPMARTLVNETNGLTYLKKPLSNENYAFAVSKNEEGTSILQKMNEFLKQLREDGTFDQLDQIWFGKDDRLKAIEDYSNLPSNQGTIRLATNSTVNPFVYIQNQQIVGYDIDIITRFCKKYGYGLEIHDLDFSAIIPGLVTGKYNLAAGCISVTEERKQSINFTDPDYTGGVVMMVRENTPEKQMQSIDDGIALTKISHLNGKKIGVITGMISDQIAKEKIDSVQIEYYNSYSDLALATVQGKIDGFVTDEPIARVVMNEIPGLSFIKEFLTVDSYAFPVNKNSEGDEIREKMNQFIARLQSDGTIREMDQIWFGTDDQKKTIEDFSKFPATNGTIRLAVNSVSAPFSYIFNQKITGYDIDVIVRFCKEFGYALEITDLDFGAMIPGLLSGKFNLVAGCITVTEERKKRVNFTDPDYTGGLVVVVKETVNGTNTKEDQIRDTSQETISNIQQDGFFERMKLSFNRNFLIENRWKMILRGLGVTLLISILSAIFGTILGFIICLCRLSRQKAFNLFAKIFVAIIQGTPVVVLLMILFYVVFGSSKINPVIIAVLGFLINFAAYVSEMMRTGIESVDKGQIEAASAIGFNNVQTFIRITLPQAAKQFIPVYKGEFISMVKMTSVVGYIAIQDLTKMSDIIRSRTYEAFFPLIVTAGIYFIIAYGLASLLSIIEVQVDPKFRKRVIKGVDLK